MKSNKEYRKDENVEDSMYRISDIVDLCDACKDNLRYMANIPEAKSNLQKIKNIITDIENMLEKVN